MYDAKQFSTIDNLAKTQIKQTNFYSFAITVKLITK